MKTIQSILTLAAVFYVGGCATTQPRIPIADKQRPAFSSLPVRYQTLLATWLNQDCRIDSANIERDIASAGPNLEDALWEAFNLGPTEQDRADLRHSLRERYALRLRWLKQHGSEAVDPSLSKQLLSESEDQFLATERAKLNNRWRDAAVTGLAFVCTDRSLERLRLIAKDERNPSSIAASEALKASRNCSAPVEDQRGRAQ